MMARPGLRTVLFYTFVWTFVVVGDFVQVEGVPSLKIFPRVRKPQDSTPGIFSKVNSNSTGNSTDQDHSYEYSKHLKEIKENDKFRGLADLLFRRPTTCHECYCGLNHREERIVGGRVAEVNSYPWLGALMYRQKFYCGISVLSEMYVLTAAHCVHGVPKEKITVVLGEHDRNSTDDSEVQYRKIETVIRHELFNRANFHNDIAILRLDRPLRFNRAVGPACLPFGEDFDDESFEGEFASVAGWGRTMEKGKPSHILREVVVPIMTNDECVETNYSEREISDNMLCAGYEHGKLDACQGDSGGPLNWEDGRSDSNTEGVKFVIGLVSWGQGCARPLYPGVYTRITKYLGWIKSKISDACLCSPPTS